MNQFGRDSILLPSPQDLDLILMIGYKFRPPSYFRIKFYLDVLNLKKTPYLSADLGEIKPSALIKVIPSLFFFQNRGNLKKIKFK